MPTFEDWHDWMVAMGVSEQTLQEYLKDPVAWIEKHKNNLPKMEDWEDSEQYLEIKL